MADGKEVRTSGLFLYGDVGKVLQYGMRSDGEDSGYSVQVQAFRLQGRFVETQSYFLGIRKVIF